MTLTPSPACVCTVWAIQERRHALRATEFSWPPARVEPHASETSGTFPRLRLSGFVGAQLFNRRYVPVKGASHEQGREHSGTLGRKRNHMCA